MKEGRPSFTSLVACAFVLMSGYFLSLGPLYALCFAGYIPDNITPLLSEVFRPLDWLADNVDWIGAFQQWWVQLWI